MSPEKMHDMKPLFVDLEGTLVATDTRWESVLIAGFTQCCFVTLPFRSSRVY